MTTRRDPTPVGWNPGARRYVDPASGRFIAPSTVRAAVRAVIDGAGRDMRAHTQTLINGGAVDDWRSAMAGSIRAVHTVAAVTARGGFAQMTPRDWGRVGAATRAQYAYLDNYAADLASGRIDIARGGALLTRSSMYADAATATFENAARDLADQAGDTQERNVLAGDNHCVECADLTDQGWVPIGTLPAPGLRLCRTNCNCYLETR